MVAVWDSCDRNVGEATAFVAVEYIGTKIGDEEIGVSVIVVIPRATAHAVTGIGNAGRRFAETPVGSVAVERVAGRLGRYVTGQIGSVDDVEIHVPIAVVIKKSGSRAEGFHPVLPPCKTAGMLKVNTSGRGYIGKVNCRCRPLLWAQERIDGWGIRLSSASPQQEGSERPVGKNLSAHSAHEGHPR